MNHKFNINKKYSNLCFTLNNYYDVDVKEIKNTLDKARYYVIGYEVGDKGTPHIQGYVEWGKQVTGKFLTKICDGRIHWEDRIGTSKEASDYCKKDGKFDEFGKSVTKGERTDITDLRDRIVSGETNIDEIIINEPQAYHNYGRTLEEIQVRKYNLNKRTEMTKGIWYWGPTNIGKSHSAHSMTTKGDGDLSYYTWEIWPDKKGGYGWQDDYRQQDVIIIDDFRGEISYNNILKLCDKWDCKIPMRNKQSMYCTSKFVIITSAKPPWEIYCNQIDNTDSINQLMRRFNVYNKKKKDDDWLEYKYCHKHNLSYNINSTCDTCDKINMSKVKKL